METYGAFAAQKEPRILLEPLSARYDESFFGRGGGIGLGERGIVNRAAKFFCLLFTIVNKAAKSRNHPANLYSRLVFRENEPGIDNKLVSFIVFR